MSTIKKEYKKEECELINCYENLSHLKRTELLIELFKYKWSIWTIKTIIFGLIVIFIFAVLSIFFKDKVSSEGILSNSMKIFSALQVWAGFALGIIATLFSIISMYLSFYNLEQQRESEKNVQNLNEDLKTKIVNEIKRDLELIGKDLKEELHKTNDLVKEMSNTNKTIDTAGSPESNQEISDVITDNIIEGERNE